MAEKWITYFRQHHRAGNGETKFTKLASESVARPGSWQQRPATDEEISEAKAKREQKKSDEAAWQAFRGRPEYIAAMAIRDRLEWITPEDHPLGMLTVEEWEALQKKLT